ncbi:MAG: hypothetical protein NW200_13815 [Hyphomonadaceae bacterium]|nr:hypothetical protein [Hyphomonadaceae bacterium]
MRLSGALAAALLTLPGCFASREPLVTQRESARLFGDQGFAKRVSFDRMGGGPLADMVAYRWNGDTYEIVSLANPRERVRYRVVPLNREWILAQVEEGGRATYGLGRREGPRIWTYAPECRQLTDADRDGLRLTFADGQTCLVENRAQLRAALERAVQRGMRPDGYYEAAPPPLRR